MSELALKIIAENKAKHARGEDARMLDLGKCGLTTLSGLSELEWLETLIVSNRWWDERQQNWIESKNQGYLNRLVGVSRQALPSKLKILFIGGVHDNPWEISNWDFLKNLTQLQSLDLSCNQLSNGDFLKNLTQLQSLDLRSNRISNWNFLKNLTQLKFLKLGKNQTSKWDFLENLTQLESGDMSYSADSKWDFLNNLMQLQSLDLCSNRISSGHFLKNFTHLQSLDLHNNQISNWDFLKNLTQLQILNLNNNQISNADFLKNLTQLQILDLSINQISNGDFLKNFTQLKILRLGNNQISNWDFLKNLTQLQILDLSNNRISNADFLKNLTQLQTLHLGNNQISNADFLKNLTQLQTLDLSNNQISNLEPLIPLMKKGIRVDVYSFLVGDSINLHANSFTHPPVEIVVQGNAAILRYFDDLEKSGSDQIYEAKLLLIGEGGAGKTTLCRKLFDPAAPLPQEKDRTRGIDIQPLYFDVPGIGDKQFRLNIWDFAGQGKYQSAHSFFYTYRSLYVFVDDTRTLNENDAYRTLYNNWLQTAELFGGQSPVLVLHNEKEGCARLGFSLGSFQERFSFVHGELFRINLGGSDTTKISDLRRQIERQALALPHIGDTVPKTWAKVREAIEAERAEQPYISAERYRELCIQESITDLERQSGLSRYFHDLGVFLHFQDNPLLKHDVFLQNQWVTDAVYKILDDDQIAGEQRGRFTPKDLARLWNEGAYRERRDELLALMLQFELCYRVQDTDTYVCPQLLPGHVPTYDLGPDVPLQLKYEYGFMPKGLLYRLIVRLHHHIAQAQTAVWNSGAVLERIGAQADIIESLDQRIISVRATGPRAKELVTIINEEVERLHAPFGERLRVAVNIPCNCRICKESNRPHFYDKTDLDTRLLKGKPTVECRIGYDDVPVAELLDGVFEKNMIFSKEDIHALFKSGKMEAALKALCETGDTEASTLLGSFLEAQKEHLGGRIGFEAFEQLSNRVRMAGLKLLE